MKNQIAIFVAVSVLLHGSAHADGERHTQLTHTKVVPIQKRLGTHACPIDHLRSIDVVDAAGKPIPQPRITDLDKVGDVRGHFELTPSGDSCGVLVTAAGYSAVRVPAEQPHARVTLTPAATAHFTVHAGDRPCPRAQVTFDPPPPPPDDHAWVGNLVVHAYNQKAGKVRATVTCGVPDVPSRTLELELRIGDNTFDVPLDDPSVKDPANHFEIRGKVTTTEQPVNLKAQAWCGALNRSVEVKPDLSFVIPNLPAASHCNVSVFDEVHRRGVTADVPAPTKDLLLHLE